MFCFANYVANPGILCTIQDKGLANNFEIPEEGPAYYRGSIQIRDSASVESSVKQACP